MAKKKAGKKKAGKPAKKGKAARGAKQAKPAVRARGPRSQTLPGMEQVRIGRLDNLCEAIAETRAEINELKATEAGNEQAALKVMQQHETMTYKHGGVQLIRVPGDEKLSVRTSKDTTGNDAGGDAGGGDAAGGGIDEGAGGEAGVE